MKENREKFKQFVIEQLKDYDEWRESSPDGYAEIITDEAVKLFVIPDVSNWGEMKLACKYSKKHDKFTACLHKDADPAMICFAPAHCPMIKKWSKCAFNRPDW